MQKVVRTYPHGFTNSTLNLKSALEDGYEVILCNTIKGKDGVEVNEYILEKKQQTHQ